jgi:rod shape-determining protein MreC
MAELRQDSFARSLPARIAPQARSGRRPASFGLVVCIVSALFLLVLSRVEHAWLQSLRVQLTDAFEPALDLARLPVQAARALADATAGDSELLRQVAVLKRENQELRQWRLRAEDLESQVSELRRIVGGVPERRTGIATGRIFVEGHSSFAASAILDIGAANGVKPGFAAINADGLVGTVIEAGERSARLLLLNDRRSRIPVFVGKERLRGILAGHGGSVPHLELVMAAAVVDNGELVTTSGEDGVLPRGLPVGFVEVGDGVQTVRLNAAPDRLDFVSVLLFEPPGSDLAQGGLGLGQ